MDFYLSRINCLITQKHYNINVLVSHNGLCYDYKNYMCIQLHDCMFPMIPSGWIYVLEMALKVYSFGFENYWRDGQNRFDFLITWIIGKFLAKTPLPGVNSFFSLNPQFLPANVFISSDYCTDIISVKNYYILLSFGIHFTKKWLISHFLSFFSLLFII